MTAWRDRRDKGWGARRAQCPGFRWCSPKGSPPNQAMTRTTCILCPDDIEGYEARVLVLHTCYREGHVLLRHGLRRPKETADACEVRERHNEGGCQPGVSARGAGLQPMPGRRAAGGTTGMAPLRRQPCLQGSPPDSPGTPGCPQMACAPAAGPGADLQRAG